MLILEILVLLTISVEPSNDYDLIASSVYPNSLLQNNWKKR